jgi:hypothetical protein
MSINTSKLLTRSLVGAMGLGVALLGIPQSAKAATVNAGTDYVITPVGGATYYFEDTPLGAGLVPVSFEGLPIGTPTMSPPDGGFSGNADTVINRLSNVNATASGETTPIEIVGLSLQSLAVNGFDVFVGLQKYRNNTISSGTMTIRDDGVNKTWDSSFTINGVAIFAPVGTLTPTGTDFVRELVEGCDTVGINYQCENFTKGPFTANNEPWSDTPGLGQLTGANLVSADPSNFFLTGTVIHDAGDGVIHTIDPKVPEPSTSAGLVLLGLGSLFGLKRKNK